jgi:two-component system response regulator VicR
MPWVTDPEVAGGRRVVLVVDDDRAVQDAVREELGHRDYEVVIVSDGESALRLLDSLEPDVLVLDLELPNVSGPTVAARLRRMANPPRLLICSAIPYAPEIATDVEADAILLKPFVRSDLRSEVERLLRERQ